jgi:tetratricopeptide (TPR) repeat protein
VAASARSLARLLLPELLVAVPAVAVLVLWWTADAGFEPASWYAGGLFLLGLLVAAALGFRRTRPHFGLIAGASLALAAFAGWCFLSIAWAGAPGDAWEGANRVLVYLAVFALFALPPWRATSGATLLGAIAVGICAVGLATLAQAASDSAPELFFIDGRFVEPTGYHNASAALSLIGFWPAAALASRPEVPVLARALLLAVAGALLQLAVLPQSRGGALAAAITLLVYLLVSTSRLRTALWLVPPAIALFVVAPTLLDVYDAVRAGTPQPAVDDALRAVLITIPVLFAAGVALALADRRLRFAERTRRRANVAAAGLAAVGAIAAIVLALVAMGNPSTWVEERWDDFTGGYEQADFSSSRFSGSLGSNRYDFWRVSFAEFADSPLLGTGIDNFAAEYLQDRRSEEEPKHPHSLPAKVLGQTGLVGSLLFAAFLGLAGAAAIIRRRQTSSPLSATVGAAAITSVAYFLVHAAGDWLWAFPGIAATAFAMLAVASRVRSDAAEKLPADEEVSTPWPLVVGGGLVALAAAASLAFPLGAVRETDRGLDEWQDDLPGALERFDRARELNPLTDRPDLLAATVALSSREGGIALARYEAALERNESNWYAAAQAAILHSIAGDFDSARDRAEIARRLNPEDPAVRTLERRIGNEQEIAPNYLIETVEERVCSRVGRTRVTRSCSG